MYAHTLPGPEKLCECFYADDIQLQIQVGPPGKQPVPTNKQRIAYQHLSDQGTFTPVGAQGGFLGPVAAPEFFCGGIKGSKCVSEGAKIQKFAKNG